MPSLQQVKPTKRKRTPLRPTSEYLTRAELLAVRAEITADTAVAVDAVLLDATAADTIRPAGLRNGVARVDADRERHADEKMAANVKALVAAIAASHVALIANPAQAMSLRSIYDADALTVIASANVTPGMVLAIDLESFTSASALPKFSVSEEALIHEESETPLPLVGGTAQPPALGSVAAPARSLFQTAVIGVRARSGRSIGRCGALAALRGWQR